MEINTNEKIVRLATLETGVNTITCDDDRVKICTKMCEYAKEDGVKAINTNNPNLCESCSLYETNSKS